MGKAGVWIHAHIHESVDCQVRGTRIISNPRGYMLAKPGGMQNSAFREGYPAGLHNEWR